MLFAAACIAAALAHSGRAAAREQEKRGGAISFNRDIRPILAENCFSCHGPDESRRKTRFHFDTREGAFAKNGVIVPGSAATSLVIQR